MSRATDEVVEELGAMRGIAMITRAQADRAIQYVREHAAEVEEFMDSMNETDAADMVLDLVGRH
jgi:hypothetical protein